MNQNYERDVMIYLNHALEIIRIKFQFIVKHRTVGNINN